MFLVFDKTNLDHRYETFERELGRAQKKVKALLKLPEKTFETFAVPYWMANERLGWTFHPLSHLNSVKNSAKSQKIYAKALAKYTEYTTALMQDNGLYDAFREIREAQDVVLREDQKTALDQLLLDFRLGGVDQSKKVKKRLSQIDLRLSELQNRFSQNVLDDTNAFEMILSDETDVAELPEADKKSAAFDDNGTVRYRFTLRAPSYIAYMTYGSNRSRREELYRAYVTRGAANTSLIDEILSLRDEQAGLLGFETFSDVSLATKDAPSAEAVVSFLRTLGQKSRPFALLEKEQLRQFAAAQGCEDLKSFDIAYYSEKLRKQAYDVDEEFYRPYFEQSRVVAGMMDFVCDLFGVTIKPIATRTWDKSVTVYDFYDDGKVFARLYLDLESRKDKKGGAWMDNAASYCLDENGQTILPIAYIVCNFPPSSPDAPSLLKHSDVETLFHEMGHALHHLFSTVPTVAVSGVNGVAWDVVEFPSQFFEQFVFERDILRRFAVHYESGEALPEEAIERLRAARNFQAALGMVRQLEFALFDFLVHQGAPRGDEVQRVLDDVRGEVAVFMPPAYNKFQNSFTHIFAGGYAAGYYSYKWAEVLSADLFMSMIAAGHIDRALADRYRRTVLAKGGAVPMKEMFEALLERPRDDAAILKLYGLEGE